MMAEQDLFYKSVFFLMFVAGGFAADTNERDKIDELISQLGQRDFQNTIDALTRIGEPAVEPLIHTLQDRSIKTWNVHARAVDALVKIGSQRAVEAVVKSLEDNELNPYVRGSAAIAIAELKPKEAAEALSHLSRDKNQFIRWKCVQALGMLGDKKGTGILIRALNDEDQYVRAASAVSLGQIRAENTADSLINAFIDESWLVRLNAREALLQIGEPADEQLIVALKDKNNLTRW